MRRIQRNSSSIGYKMAVIFILVSVAQGAVMSSLLVAGGILSQSRDNAYSHFYMQVNSRKSNLENEMKNVWTNFGNYTGQLSSYFTEYRSEHQEAGEGTEGALAGAAPYLLEALRSTKTTGVFLLLDNEGSKDNTYSALYIRNMNPEKISADNFTLTMLAGPLDVARQLKIPTGPNWRYRLSLDEGSKAFYEKAFSNRDIPADESFLGYWCPPFNLPGDGERAITYSVPLNDSQGRPVGVFGIEVSESYLYQFLPKTDLAGTSPYGYILAMRNKNSGQLTPIAWQGALQERMLRLDEPLSLAVKGVNYNVCELKNHNSKKDIYCCINRMGLYYNNTPFDNEEWYLIGLVDQSALLWFSNRITVLLLACLLTTAAAGAAAAIGISRWFTKPIVDLADKVKNLSEADGALNPIGLLEIDGLSKAIMDSRKQLRELNEQLKRERDKDPLTGIRNRHAFNRYMEYYNGRLDKERLIALGIFDLNGLKSVNDNYGHEAGDLYIGWACRLICSVFEGVDVFRIGGDEFACIFINIEEGKIQKLHKQMEGRMEEYHIDGYFHAGIAFGYAFYAPGERGGLENVLIRADEKMYKNKKEMKSRE